MLITKGRKSLDLLAFISFPLKHVAIEKKFFFLAKQWMLRNGSFWVTSKTGQMKESEGVNVWLVLTGEEQAKNISSALTCLFAIVYVFEVTTRNNSLLFHNWVK